jgi:predicted peroxiredoxin
MARMLVSITHAKDNRDKATIGFVVANAAAASGVETAVFLTSEGVYLSQLGYSDDIHEEGFQPLPELINSYVANGGQIWVCSPCFKRRDLAEDRLVGTALITGAAKAVEFLIGGAACMSY